MRVLHASDDRYALYTIVAGAYGDPVLDDYWSHETERGALGIPPLPLNADQIRVVADALRDGSGDERLLDLLAHRVSPGVAEAAGVKAHFLGEVASGAARCADLDRHAAVALLGTMVGGYCITALTDLLEDPETAGSAAAALGRLVLVGDGFDRVAHLAAAGYGPARSVLESWAAMDWLAARAAPGPELKLTVFKVEGETNTDDLSPATQAWCRADIPLHARSLLENRLGTGVAPRGIEALTALGRPVVFVGDVVGTGSSRKSSVNSLQWHIGSDIPWVPNKRSGGVVMAGRLAPIFRDTLLDSGALPFTAGPEVVGRVRTGDQIVVRLDTGIVSGADGAELGSLEVPPSEVLAAVRAGGRIPLIIGRRLARRASQALGDDRRIPAAEAPRARSGRYTLAQKIVGRACGVEGVDPGSYCEPVVSTVGSQDTTGPMNRTELEDLACLQFGADLVLQSFCHTVAYPKPSDIQTQATLPAFMATRGAVVLRPGDGIIHSWLNRMLLPDQVGTGSDSHTRFPLGISFPAGSGLVALAAAFGFMPLTMPESVLVRFGGERRPGITVRDLVHAIPYFARQAGLLGRGENVFSGRILEIEGLDDLTIDEAFELADASAERSAAACTLSLSEETVARHIRDSARILRELLDAGYEGSAALSRRIDAMEGWLASPTLLQADPDAMYAAVVDIDAGALDEPLLACPNDPDDIRLLSEVAGNPVDEVFIGSCMTHIGHFRSAGKLLADAGGAVPVRLWVAPPTSLVERRLRSEGVYSTFGAAGARTEVPGCSLCMGNQARVADGATVVSTSTRNFPNRMGKGASVYLDPPPAAHRRRIRSRGHCGAPARRRLTNQPAARTQTAVTAAMAIAETYDEWPERAATAGNERLDGSPGITSAFNTRPVCCWVRLPFTTAL
jgi:aconitate hydratase 2/2-methylisocitrate dehydratase